MLTEKAKELIKKLAHETPVRESCGLVYGDEVIQVTNIHPSPDKAFLLDPERYVDVVTADGEPDYVWHSHPATDHSASPSDIAGCNETCLPYAIYSLVTNEFSTLDPQEIELPLENRPFAFPGADCWCLVRDYFERELGITLKRFDYDYTAIVKGLPFNAVPIEEWGFKRVSDPRKNDVVAMSLRAGGKVNHIAIYNGDGTIFHQLMERPSRHEVYGGYWKQNTVGFFRHDRADGKS